MVLSQDYCLQTISLPMLTFFELIDLAFPPKISQNISNHVVALSLIEESIVLLQFIHFPKLCRNLLVSS